jgi:hypothetical protein
VNRSQPDTPPGATPSEQYLGSLCRRTFLSLWSYQNVFTDRGLNPTNRQGKELCDLLVVFENDLIVFSDKSCAMPSTGDVALDWARWYRRAIEKSADQIFGAERWLSSYPHRLFIDPACTKPFPIPIPSRETRRVHRIVVALGAGERAAQFFGGNSTGSLMLTSRYIAGGDGAEEPLNIPFMVGRIHPTKGYVHVLDDLTLDIVMRELDTITDFVSYLTSKEQFFRGHGHLTCAGEEDFLGFYLANLDESGTFRSHIIEEAARNGVGTIHIGEGIWDDFLHKPEVQRWHQIRQVGKFVDALIEDLTRHLRAGTLVEAKVGASMTHEENLRLLTSEPRAIRARIATVVAQKLETTPPNLQTSAVLPLSKSDRLFVFLLLPRDAGQTERSYRQERHAVMMAYAQVVKHTHASIRYVICLATEPGPPGKLRSEDLMSFDFHGWDAKADAAAAAAKLQQELGILVDFDVRMISGRPNTRRGDLAGGNRKQRRTARAQARTHKRKGN